LAVLLVDADLAEAERAEERAAWRVLDKDAREQFPEAGPLGDGDQRLHRQPARAATTRLARYVDRELGDAGVALARPVRRGGGKSHHVAIGFHHDDRVSAVEPGADVLGRAQGSLEGGDA